MTNEQLETENAELKAEIKRLQGVILEVFKIANRMAGTDEVISA